MIGTIYFTVTAIRRKMLFFSLLDLLIRYQESFSKDLPPIRFTLVQNLGLVREIDL